MLNILILIFCFITFSYAQKTPTEKPIARTPTDKNLKWGPCPDVFPKGCEVSVLHGSPERPGADVFLRVPGNYTIPAHTHTSAEHMTLVSGSLQVKYKDNDSMNLVPGMYAFGPAQHPHEGKCVSSDPCVLFISFDTPVDAKAYSGAL